MTVVSHAGMLSDMLNNDGSRSSMIDGLKSLLNINKKITVDNVLSERVITIEFKEIDPVTIPEIKEVTIKEVVLK